MHTSFSKGDIAREKIPKLLEKKAGGKLDIVNITGTDFPDNLSKYKLIIHCGSCMFTRKVSSFKIRTSERTKYTYN